MRRSVEATYVEHWADLRRRLITTATVVLVVTVLVFSFRVEATQPYVTPSLTDSMAAQAYDGIQNHLRPDNVTLVALHPMDGFTAQLFVALAAGVGVAMPVIVWQAGGFLWPALHERERRAVVRAFAPAVLLFAAGAAFCWFLVLPFILETLYGYATAIGARPLLAVHDLISFAVGLILVFGFAFQTPLVMAVLARIGLATWRGYLRLWRHAIIAILILSAFVTDPSVVSQFMVAGPLILLYFMGVGLAALTGRRRADAAQA